MKFEIGGFFLALLEKKNKCKCSIHTVEESLDLAQIQINFIPFFHISLHIRNGII